MEIEFRYGVLDGEISIPKEDASDITSCRSSRALDLPCDDARVLKDSSHSSVSSGSVSGRVCRGSGGAWQSLTCWAKSPVKRCFLNGSTVVSAYDGDVPGPNSIKWPRALS